jgi:hypothetical protein
MVGCRKLSPSPTELIVILTPTVVQPLAMPGRERPAIPLWPAPFLQASELDPGPSGGKKITPAVPSADMH